MLLSFFSMEKVLRSSTQMSNTLVSKNLLIQKCLSRESHPHLSVGCLVILQANSFMISYKYSQSLIVQPFKV